MGKVIGIIGYMVGIIIILLGLLWLGWTMTLPLLFAGQYLIVGIIILVLGVVIMYFAHKSYNKRKLVS